MWHEQKQDKRGWFEERGIWTCIACPFNRQAEDRSVETKCVDTSSPPSPPLPRAWTGEHGALGGLRGAADGGVQGAAIGGWWLAGVRRLTDGGLRACGWLVADWSLAAGEWEVGAAAGRPVGCVWDSERKGVDWYLPGPHQQGSPQTIIAISTDHRMAIRRLRWVTYINIKNKSPYTEEICKIFI